MVEDDARQAAAAREVMSRGFTLIASVLLETEWVLRSSYGWPRTRIAEALANLIDLPTLHDAPPGIGWAIDRFAAGADFADMLHLASSASTAAFVTFDKRLARAAGPQAPVAVETLR